MLQIWCRSLNLAFAVYKMVTTYLYRPICAIIMQTLNFILHQIASTCLMTWHLRIFFSLSYLYPKCIFHLYPQELPHSQFLSHHLVKVQSNSMSSANSNWIKLIFLMVASLIPTFRFYLMSTLKKKMFQSKSFSLPKSSNIPNVISHKRKNIKMNPGIFTF